MKNCLIFLFSIISAWTTAQSIDTTAINDRLIDLGQIADTVFPAYDKLQEAIGDAEIVMLGGRRGYVEASMVSGEDHQMCGD